MRHTRSKESEGGSSGKRLLLGHVLCLMLCGATEPEVAGREGPIIVVLAAASRTVGNGSDQCNSPKRAGLDQSDGHDMRATTAYHGMWP